MAPARDQIQWFVLGYPSGADVTCRACLTAAEVKAATTDGDAYQIWEEYSHGWMGAPVCERCKLSLPVFVDGTQPKEK